MRSDVDLDSIRVRAPAGPGPVGNFTPGGSFLGENTQPFMPRQRSLFDFTIEFEMASSVNAVSLFTWIRFSIAPSCRECRCP
jgi:hypothetical protein